MKTELLLAALALVNAPLLAHADILAGPITNPANGHLYYLLSQNAWAPSETEAGTLGGHLVTINDQAENDWVATNFGAYGGTLRALWIGLSDAAQEGVFTWANGDPSVFRAWEPGQPDNEFGAEDCVHIWPPGGFRSPGLWNDYWPDRQDVKGYPLHGVVEVAVPVYPLPDSFNPAPNARVLGLVLQPDGKIMAGGGFTRLGGQTRNYIGRLNADGTLDTGFNPGANNWVLSLAAQADGKVLVGGSFSTFAGQARVGTARMNANGTLDTGFNPGVTWWPGEIGLGHLVQADAKIQVFGEFSILAGKPRNYIGRLNADGTLDTSFNPGANASPWAAALQPDEKILQFGEFTTLAGQPRMYIGRLNPDGAADAAFNPGANNYVLAAALQADGKVLVGGGFTSLAGRPRNYIGRLNADGTLDPAFNPGANSNVWEFAVQTDGKIVVGGGFTTLAGQPRNRIARLNADGTLDTAFNPGANEWVGSLALQADGKILVGGLFTTLGGLTRTYFGRLNNTGPATESLAYDGSTITWLRGGTSPEVWRTTFDLSTDGITWTALGAGARATGGWQLPVLSPPQSGLIRARGYATGGRNNGSSWFVETQLRFTNAPTIVQHPQSVTKIAATTATFAVNAAGREPLAFQWRKEGLPLADAGNVSGAASPLLTLANVQWDNAGQYSVVVTNTFGSVTSRTATLTVLVPPQIFVQPQSQAVLPGANVLFTVAVAGTTPLYCQWRKDHVNIPGANMAALAFSAEPSDLGRYSVLVWNAAGSAVSAEASLVVLADPANGHPPALLAYSSLPPREPGKNNLVLVTHGWSVPWHPLPEDVPWLNDCAATFSRYLADHAYTDWQVVPYKWLENSYTGREEWETWLLLGFFRIPTWADRAAQNGASEGGKLGRDIVNQGWQHVHLIGHSAGAALIQSASDTIKALNDNIVVHETFLDPYLQTGYPGRSAYGAKADWADSYFGHDFQTDDAGHLLTLPSLTEGPLAHAYNVDVTQLDPSAWTIPAYCGSLLNPLQVCGLEVASDHEWPHHFYTNSVFNRPPEAEGLGFPLSKEGGGWDNRGNFPPGKQPRVLGNLGMVLHNEIQATVNAALGLENLLSQVSPSGIVRFLQNGFRALTSAGGGLRLKGPRPMDAAGPPVWVSFAVPVTNQVNFVTFEAAFEGTNAAAGLLSVYWGTNLIATVDEQVVVPGQQRYSFALPEIAATGLYLLGFRLDPYSDSPSSVNVTNVATGFSGVAVPIQLQITRTAPNANPAITLTAAPGFYYQLQTSPDLVNWTPLASVLNTNGTAQIIDTTTNALPQRFYRAVMP